MTNQKRPADPASEKAGNYLAGALVGGAAAFCLWFALPLAGVERDRVCWLHLIRAPRAPEPTPEEKAMARLAEADEKAAKARAARLGAVRDFFERGRRGARAFAEDALSWSGKWAFLSGTIGLSEEDEHKRFLNEAFANRVFPPDGLKREVESAVKGYVLDLEAIENELIVGLRADLADAGRSPDDLPAHLRDDRVFKEEFGRLAADGAEALKLDVGVTFVTVIASEAASTVAVRIGQAVAAELGVEAGILGAGAAGSVASLGATLAIAVAVDYALGKALKAAGYDPEAEIAAKVRASLEKIEKPLLEGEKGLTAELGKIHEARSRLRREVVEKLLDEVAFEEGVDP